MCAGQVEATDADEHFKDAKKKIRELLEYHAPIYTKKQELFRTKLEYLINEMGMENTSNTPDYILATYLTECLIVFNEATIDRTSHYDNNSKE